MGNTLISNSPQISSEVNPDLCYEHSSSSATEYETLSRVQQIEDKKLCEYCQEYNFQQFHEQHIRICTSNPANFRTDIELSSSRSRITSHRTSRAELQKIPCEFCSEPCFIAFQADHKRICPKNPENIKINCKHCKQTLNLMMYQNHLDPCEENHKQRRSLSETHLRVAHSPLKNHKKCKTHNDINLKTCETPKSNKASVECPICLEGILQADFSSPLLQCSHKFHRVCIQKWFKRQRRCPICRTRV